MSSVLFLFLSHLAIGIVLTLPFVSRHAGVKFFRFNAGLATVILAVALALRPAGQPAPGAAAAAWACVWAATGAIAAYWVTVGRVLGALKQPLLWTAAAAGAAALVLQGIALAPAGDFLALLTPVSFATSAALLGAACTAMVLGHWYLILPSMDVGYLQSIVRIHIAALLLRVVVVGTAVALAFALWSPDHGPRFDRYVFSSAGVFLWQRVLFGLAGPLVLSYLTWETAKIRSTQSATGILYVDFFTVIVGEVLAKYLLLTIAVPV
jgi:hypothetical protein